MKKQHFSPYFICCVVAILILTFSAAAQNGKKKNKSNTGANDANDSQTPMPLNSDAAQIENNIGEMLAAFQLGKVEMMHKYYSDNASFVSSDYAPPVMGWANYAPLYQRQWAAFQGIQLTRRNTEIFTHGDVAWATYEWEFDSSYDDTPYSVRGQTTLVFNKIGGNWLIVHNHTSEVIPTPAARQTAQQQARPLQQSDPASGSARP